MVMNISSCIITLYLKTLGFTELNPVTSFLMGFPYLMSIVFILMYFSVVCIYKYLSKNTRHLALIMSIWYLIIWGIDFTINIIYLGGVL